MARTNFDQLLQAGCHFGHLKRKWNPAMAPYIYTERNGIHIIDLHKTVAKIDEAAEALKQIAKSGKKILFVATKKQAKSVVADQLQVEGVQAGDVLTVYNANGQLMRKVAAESTSQAIDVAGMAHGIYILKVNNTSVKFIKE